MQNFIVRELINLPVELLKNLFGGGGETTERPSKPTVTEEEREVPTRGGPKKIPQRDVILKNFRFTIPYKDVKRRGSAPTHTQKLATARTWFKASHPDAIHTVTKIVVTQQQNFAQKWHYAVDLYLNLPLVGGHT